MTSAALLSVTSAWDPNLRLAGVNLLGKLYSRAPDPAGIPSVVAGAIIDLLSHDSASLRASAAKVAGELKLVEATEKLVDIVQSDFDVVSRDAAEIALRLIKSIWSGPLLEQHGLN
jgi:HEAT repeat protein